MPARSKRSSRAFASVIRESVGNTANQRVRIEPSITARVTRWLIVDFVRSRDRMGEVSHGSSEVIVVAVQEIELVVDRHLRFEIVDDLRSLFFQVFADRRFDTRFWLGRCCHFA